MRKRKGTVLTVWAVMTGFALAQGDTATEQSTHADAAAQVSTLTEKGVKSFEWGLLLETEGYYARRSSDVEESDILLATVELVMDAAVNEWISGHVGLLWEQYNTEVENLDEGFIRIGGEPAYGVYSQVGKYYLPFGNFESAFVSDPLTLELAEINKSAFLLGYGSSLINVTAGAFQGDVKEDVPVVDGGDSTISDFFASATLVPVDAIELGVYWLSDLMETDGQRDLGGVISQEPGYNKDGGAGAFVNVFLGPVLFAAEYVSSINGYDLADGRLVPTAFNIECAWRFAEHFMAGLKYEASNDLYSNRLSGPVSYGDTFPGQTVGGVISYAFQANTILSLEYLHSMEMENNEDGDRVTVQLVFEI
jgi:hypothetical protein